MKRWVAWVSWTALLCLLSPAALASGSAGAGNSKVSARGAYTVGKALVFRQLVCSRCPTQRSEFGRDRARELKGTLLQALDGLGQQRPAEVRALCAGAAEPANRCITRIKFVVSYLDRRYRF